MLYLGMATVRQDTKKWCMFFGMDRRFFRAGQEGQCGSEESRLAELDASAFATRDELDGASSQ